MSAQGALFIRPRRACGKSGSSIAVVNLQVKVTQEDSQTVERLKRVQSSGQGLQVKNFDPGLGRTNRVNGSDYPLWHFLEAALSACDGSEGHAVHV